MRAVVTYEHGGLDRLVYEAAYRDPVAGLGDVILRVRACTLNYHDVFTRKGMPGIKIPMPLILGIDVAGEIASLGPDVSGFAVGDRVMVLKRGENVGERQIKDTTEHEVLGLIVSGRSEKALKAASAVEGAEAALDQPPSRGGQIPPNQS